VNDRRAMRLRGESGAYAYAYGRGEHRVPESATAFIINVHVTRECSDSRSRWATTAAAGQDLGTYDQGLDRPEVRDGERPALVRDEEQARVRAR
jgi:hypothetical protein